MSDLISREDVIELLTSRVLSSKGIFGDLGGAVSGVRELIKAMPSAEPEEEVFEWCHDCKEYNQEKHCCHRWTKVIRQTVEEMKAESERKWIPVTEALPEEENKSYWVCTDTKHQCECRWTNNIYGIGESNNWGWKIFDIPQYTKVVAWMPLPEPWRGE